MQENPPVALLLVPLPALAGLVAAIVVGLISGSWLWALIAFVLVLALVFALAFYFADAITLRLLGGRPLREGGSHMLRNQLEELCARTGVTEPDLYTVGEGAPAIASFGRQRPSLVVTDGLSEDLTVVELEAAVARELARSRSGSMTVDTLAVTFLTLPFGLLGGLGTKLLHFVRGGDHDARTDLEGVEITRYPPGLSAALSKMKMPANQPAAVSHLWSSGPNDDAAAIGRFGLAERLELLNEL